MQLLPLKAMPASASINATACEFCVLTRSLEQVAVALTRDDAVRAHARDELGIDIDNLTNPWQVPLVMLLVLLLLQSKFSCI